MIKTASVYIWNEFAGAIAWDESTQTASFEYEPGFISEKRDLAPIKMPVSSRGRIFSFPELRNIKTFNGLPGLLADSLPDKYGNQVIDTWLAQQ